MSVGKGPSDVLNRARGALWGIFIGDGLGMPVHWYYNPNDIVTDFGSIEKYEAPKKRHPSSIMSLSNTGGGGRGGQSGRIIGDVINHGKHVYWGDRNTHYHQGMQAGENTLNAQCARVAMRSIVSRGGFDPSGFLQDYAKFMTTPGTHNDTYAETYHRMFFANFIKGVPLERCADNDGHNTDSAGGLVTLPVASVHSALMAMNMQKSQAEVTKIAEERTARLLLCTHRSDRLAAFARVYGGMLANLVAGADLRSEIEKAAASVGWAGGPQKLLQGGYRDEQVVGRMLSPACYIGDSFKIVLFLAYKYAGRPRDAMVANVNLGGENVHRGAALGALLGAAHGICGWPSEWVSDLFSAQDIKKEVDSLVGMTPAAPPAPAAS
uniref:ADP-ribosylglycohydrolase n=1 Tax=Chromera velia CCMP2878 TaxID=1169474 RepID=A0A0G4ID29_9ALVE|eukprot:Cvel_13210.t1-p1 / transcript=Cvel_13210.t1 / gene=Cvel_13210 / organism=Chromera_velia_CCMP2878 / gene_product=hypothetical protein / transcript_product=hypothetical protein / location=Cvel_scaffold894:26328-29281(-) / protein_length=379 / sequence_SO=supercontig / SO=protein_coding / is_pseudo=false